MPTYEHICNDCGNEWEDFYGITDNPPDTCPKCQSKAVQRLISLGGKGVVVLTGQDLVNKVKADANQLKKDAAKNENIYANLLGSTRYNDLQTKLDKQKR